MHLQLFVQLFILNVFLINVVICIEPITMTVVAAAMGAGWLFGGNEEKRQKTKDAVDYCSYYECCNAKHIIYDIEGLKHDLQDKLYGQHIVNDTLIRILRGHVKNLDKSEKPLVMSFHGNMGTGKNHVTDLIVKNFYKKGKNSQYVHRYRARKDFPIDSEAEVRKYRVKLAFEIEAATRLCKKSIFVFDEVEKMPAGVFESVTSMLDYHSHVDGNDFRQSIFIFLTNAGGDEIANALEGIMAKGTYREQTEIHDFEYIAEVAAYNVEGGLKKASVIKSGIIDHFLPFLPLERRHVANCVRAEFRKLNRVPTEENVTDIVENYITYKGLFSNYGCKRLNKKVQADVEVW